MKETKERPPVVMLKTLPVFSCCDHCKEAYCRDGLGHHVRCPVKGCLLGNGTIITGEEIISPATAKHKKEDPSG